VRVKKNCACGLLASLAHWAHTPVVLAAGACQLTLAQGRTVELSYCPHCAGLRRRCDCDALASWADEAPEVMRYHADLAEYRLAVGEMEVPFRFCPCCGGALRTPGRLGLEEDNSEVELRYFSELIGEAKSLDEVIRILGQPDAHSEEDRLPDELAPGHLWEVRRSLEFSHVSRTLRIIVQELRNGALRVIFGGKSAIHPAFHPE
jgi:hypothetical protein